MLMPTLLLLPVLMTSSQAVGVARDPDESSWLHIIAKLSTIEKENPHQQSTASADEMITGARHVLSNRNRIRLRAGLRSEDLDSDLFRQPTSGRVQAVEKRSSMADYIRNRWLLKGLLLKYNKDSLLDGGSAADSEQPIEDEGEPKQDVSQEAPGVGGWPMRYGRSA